MMENDLNKLKNLIENEYDVKSICKILNITTQQYRYYRLKLGIKNNNISIKNNKCKLNKKTKKEYIELKNKVGNVYRQTLNLNKTSEILNVSKDWIRRELRFQNINIFNLQNQIKINEFIFEKIITEEQAYWLGFLYADGNLHSKGNGIELTLKIDDSKHIEKFGKFLDFTGKYYNKQRQKAYKIHFSSKKVHTDLIKLGCIPKKSLILTFPTEQQVPLHLIHHFIRGYFDGDGSITDPLKVPISISLLGTKEFLESLIKTLEIKGKSSILKKNKKHLNNTFYISMSGNNARNLISYIYKDATIFLERKYDRYIKHIERINKNVKWRSDKTIYKI